MRYRREIDGLRAVALAPVILFHAHFALFKGGFVGVDVFFVISGYLITNLIRQEMQEGRFSLLGFYERRVRRIAPAMLLVTICCTPLAVAWMFPAHLSGFARSAAAANLFVANVLFWLEAGYFSPNGELKPLLPTWSLSVEEQFYIGFPVLLILLARLGFGARGRGVLGVLMALTAVSLILAEIASRAAPQAAFYLLPFRAWELGVGGVLALLIGDRPAAAGKWGQLGAAAGLAMIAGAVVSFDAGFGVPGLWALVPVLGAAAVIAFAGPDGPVGRMLGWRPLVAIGLISYSAYLWHYPIFVFARIRDLGGVSATDYLALIALTLVLAALSWRFVEQPFRNRGALSRRPLLLGLGAASACVVALGVAGYFHGGTLARMPPDVAEALAWQSATSPYRDACLDNPAAPGDPACLIGPPGAPPMAVWGDSHGAELAWRLAEGDSAAPWAVQQITRTFCPPISGVIRLQRPSCGERNAEVFAQLSAGAHPGPVVLAARWAQVFGDDGANANVRPGLRRGGGRIVMASDAGKARVDSSPSLDDALGAQLRQTVEALLEAGRRVVLVYPVPEADWSVPEYMARARLFGGRGGPAASISYADYLEAAGPAMAQMDRLPDHENLIRIRPGMLFCESGPSGRCALEIDGAPLYYDSHHVNKIGADILAQHIRDRMDERGWRAR